MVVILCAILVPAAALAFSFYQQPVYQGQANVLLSRQNLANSLTDTPDPNANASDGDRVAQTQSELAQTPIVAKRTLEAVGQSDRSVRDFLKKVDVSSATNSDILVFKVDDSSKPLAAQLANEMAKQYSLYRTEVDTSAINRALDEVDKRITALNENGAGENSTLRATLLDKQEQLRTLQALQTSNSYVVRTEDDAKQVEPTPIRNVILGFILGTMLGIGLAFALDALDTRLRSPEEIASALGLPLLIRIPIERKRKNSQLPLMLADPTSAEAEAYRLLRGNLEFASLGAEAKVVMVTSAIETEGKSTTAANLAIAYARAGKNVVLVDLDLRRPMIEKYFDLLGRPGITNVAIGALTLQHALIRIRLGGDKSKAGGGSVDAANELGGLALLPCGAIPPDPGEFIGTEALARIITTLREHFDLVLIDTPPLLRVGDPMTLAKRVDGMVLVSRQGTVRTGMAKEINRVLRSSPTKSLGVVVIGGDDGGGGYGYAYGYGYGYGYSSHDPKDSK